MKPKPFPPIPLDTAKAARAVFGRSNFYLATGDHVDQLFDGLALEEPAVKLHQPPQTLAMLYLITIFQYVEILPDLLAADALRGRIDWKYALHLPLIYPGLETGLFCDFRRWLLSDQAGRLDFQSLLHRWSKIVDFNGTGRPEPESIQVITTVCQISRLANIWESLYQAMAAVAGRRPDWLLAASLPHWYERYDAYRRNLNITAARLENSSLAQGIGADGHYLLEAIAKSGDPELAELDEVLALRELWREQFEYVEGSVLWRKKACAGCSVFGLSPHSTMGADQDKQEVK